jgi:hypothetical protein
MSPTKGGSDARREHQACSRSSRRLRRWAAPSPARVPGQVSEGCGAATERELAERAGNPARGAGIDQVGVGYGNDSRQNGVDPTVLSGTAIWRWPDPTFDISPVGWPREVVQNPTNPLRQPHDFVQKTCSVKSRTCSSQDRTQPLPGTSVKWRLVTRLLGLGRKHVFYVNADDSSWAFVRRGRRVVGAGSSVAGLPALTGDTSRIRSRSLVK